VTLRLLGEGADVPAVASARSWVSNNCKASAQQAGDSSGSSGGGGGSSSSRPGAQWLPWLLAAATSDDCLLSSYATVALLHLESAVAHHGQQHDTPPLQQQQQGTVGDAGDGSSRADWSSGGWSHRIYKDLQSAEDFAAFLEDLWPFSLGGSSSSSSTSAWRPPVYFPDGVHLLNPTDGHHWAVLQPPKATLLKSLSAAASAAATAAAAAAASDLSQSDLHLPGAPPPDATVAAAAAAATAAAAAAAALQQGSSGSVNGDSSSDLGFLQPAVIWLAEKLVRFAEIKEEQVHRQQQQQQQARHGATTPAANVAALEHPAMPLETYGAIRCLQSAAGSTSSRAATGASSGSSPAGQLAPCGQQTSHGTASGVSSKQLQQQQAVPLPAAAGAGAGAHTPIAPEYDVIFIHGIRGGPFVTWRRGGLYAPRPSPPSSSAAAAPRTASGAADAVDAELPLNPAAAAASVKHHMSQSDCWPAAWLPTDLPGARLLTVEYKVSQDPQPCFYVMYPQQLVMS